MVMKSLAISLAAGAIATAFLVSHAAAHQDHSSEQGSQPEVTTYGKPGDPTKPGRVVQVVMRESDGKMLFIPDWLEIRAGEQIQFVLRNNGALDHEFVIGTVEANARHAEEMARHGDMVHDDPNAKRLEPKKSGVLRWQFTQPGEFEVACLIPGHREVGMVGTVSVK
jgi:uncharacterized cupredoxin-like copper-binding protein